MTQIRSQAYSVKRGQEYINWWDVLDELQKIRDKIGSEYVNIDNAPHSFKNITVLSSEEKDFAIKHMHLSKSWVTCACGNQCNVIKRYPSGSPVDGDLNWNGRQFYVAINGLNIKEARNILHRIEARSEILIQETTKT
jgi:hypothetical protein